MSKDFAWQLFKNTGNVDAFMIMRDIEKYSTSYDKKNESNFLGDINGDIKNEGDCNKNC